MVKNSPTKAGDVGSVPGLGRSPGEGNSPTKAGDVASVPGLGRSPGEGNGNCHSLLAWETPWTEEPGRLQSIGSLESDTTE